MMRRPQSLCLRGGLTEGDWAQVPVRVHEAIPAALTKTEDRTCMKFVNKPQKEQEHHHVTPNQAECAQPAES